MKRYEVFLIASIFFFVLSARTSNPFFAGFAIFVLLAMTALRWWRIYVSRHLTGSIKLQYNRIFPGEKVEGELILENTGRLPVFGLMVSFDFWELCKLESDYLKVNTKNATGVFQNYQGRFNLGAKEKRRIPIKLTGLQRGAYSFKGIRLRALDPFGLDEMEKDVYFHEELLVYPEELALQGFAKTHRMPQGETIVRRWIHDDIFFPVGSRPYQAGDAFNRIDFKASAKMQAPYTKQFDFTAHGDICVIANLLTSEHNWNIDRELFERTLSLVARIARESLQKDLRLSFFSNAQMGRGARAFEIPSSSGRRHYRKILEMLARFSFFHATSFTVALSTVRHRHPNGALAVVITSFCDDNIMQELKSMLKQGFEVYVIDSSLERPTISRWTYASEKERRLQHA